VQNKWFHLVGERGQGKPKGQTIGCRSVVAVSRYRKHLFVESGDEKVESRGRNRSLENLTDAQI